MTTNNDIYYINLIIEGNTNAFSVLVDRYKDLVFSLALKMVKNREEAEEVAQDTFIKVFKSLSQFNGDSKFSTWIYKVTYNTCLDRLKKHKREQQVVSIDEFNTNQIKSLDNALDAMEDEERRQAIQDCINLLPSDDAFLLTLFYFEEQSLDEIAKVINVTANNVKVKLFRSRKKLTTILKERLEPEIMEYYER
ncbi:MAG: sigma-70 family RNA polymerase sigma factor [Flavobacteriales bacterium]|nr:sigma-70 family RNA polymerase sigma factor [Flavobacteriia bacterium]NCP04767.1 sigma-70 family RNA polymerase sigma factor [Flavobacteriales bacterium]PIV92655.1 MAG: RNA polymerase [Flavobacteriaceae bacterium CG17_big_fil_post_rev_8_21_14_2_50_33_15]PIY11117.1 MAG: RNA polymerase [Flavobacteriaceae bacterium CG_4_10_14_3_um_filter_33_47]PJB17802.1 MAG: RNA polymerase [Flavobacteriaceae bacterium CG_4_9_14_3_um_filter_33_16]